MPEYVVTGKLTAIVSRIYNALNPKLAKIGDGEFIAEEMIEELDFEPQSVEENNGSN